MGADDHGSGHGDGLDAVVPAGFVLATIPRRALGALLDQLVVLVPVALGVVAWGYRPGDELGDDALLALNLATVAVAFVYETVLIARFGRTLGKVATGTRVVRAHDGTAVGWFAAAERAVVPLAFASVPEVGFALGAIVYSMALLGPLRQGLHDRAAGTLVVLNGSPAPAR